MSAPHAALLMGSSLTNDPYWTSVVGLWHFEGTNGDTGPFHNSATAAGHGADLVRQATGPTISTAQFKFGASSYRATLSESRDSSTTPYTFGTGDFTVEFWLRVDSLAASKNILAFGNSTDSTLHTPTIYFDTNGAIYWYTDNTNRITGANGTISANTWQFVAASRVSGSTRLFVGGTQVGSTYTDSSNIGNTGGLSAGGTQDNAAPYTGYMDELRVTKGIGRYSSNFSVPTAAFPDS